MEFVSRTSGSKRAVTSDQSAESTPSTTRPTLARAIVVLGIAVAVVYAISRYRGRSGSERGAGDDADVVPVIDEDADDGTGIEESDERRTEQERTRGADDLETSVEVTAEDRSPEEIVERAREDVPEPGEMAVDEGVAEELLEEAEEVVDGEDGEEESADERTGDDPDRDE